MTQVFLLPQLNNTLDPRSPDETDLPEPPLLINHHSFNALLPYRSIGTDLIFMNHQSIGFGLHLVPIWKHDEQFMQTICQLIHKQLPDHIDCTILLHKHPYINTQLKQGLQPMMRKGGHYATVAETILNKHGAIEKQILNNDIAQVHDYCCYLFLSTPRHPTATTKLIDHRAQLESLFLKLKLPHARVNEVDFLVLMRALVTPENHHIEWPAVLDMLGKPFNQLIAPPQATFFLEEAHLDVGNQSQPKTGQARLISFQLDSWLNRKDSKKNKLPCNNRLKPELDLPCNFLMSLTLRGGNTTAARSVFYNLLIYTTNTKAQKHVHEVMKRFHTFGIKIQPSPTQWLRFLASMPFFITERPENQLQIMGMLKNISTRDLHHLLPIVATRKGSRQGLFLPTRSKQLTFLNTFDCQNYPLNNFNYLIATHPEKNDFDFLSAMIMNGLALGEKIFVIDVNHAYKKLCDKLDGHYINLSTFLSEQLKGQDLAQHPGHICVAIKRLLSQAPASSPFTVFNLHPFADRPTVLSSVLSQLIFNLFEQVKKDGCRMKMRCLIDQIPSPVLLRHDPAFEAFIHQIIDTATQLKVGVGFITNFLSDFMITKIGRDILKRCDLKVLLHTDNINPFLEKYPLDDEQVYPLIESFNGIGNIKYYDVLIEAGKTRDFHRYFIQDLLP